MADKSPIEWTDATWNPVRGCSRVSAGCMHCYAEGVAARFSGAGQPYEGLAVRTTQGPKWTGNVRLVPELLEQPLRWRKPRKVFVNSMSDLFHESVPDWFIDQVHAVMMLAPQHTFQVLTKRAQRMRSYLEGRDRDGAMRHFGIAQFIQGIAVDYLRTGSFKAGGGFGPNYAADMVAASARLHPLPLRNVQYGVSVEDQATADQRIPDLLASRAAARFISAEPLLGRIRLDEHGLHGGPGQLDWVIVGGESGAGARPMHPLWAKSLRDQCEAAGVKFFFKQWGEWGPADIVAANAPPGRAYDDDAVMYANLDGTVAPIGHGHRPSRDLLFRAGKAITGRLLDGREHNDFPSPTAALSGTPSGANA